LGRMVRRMKAAQLAAAFASFVDWASRSVSARIAVGRVLRRIKAGQLAAAFDGLTAYVGEAPQTCCGSSRHQRPCGASLNTIGS